MINGYAHNDKANLNIKDSKFGSGLMHFAAFFDDHKLIKYLHDKGVSIEQRNHSFHAPLYFAIKQQHLSSIYQLVNLGVNINVGNLYTALETKSESVIKFFLKKKLKIHAHILFNDTYKGNILFLLLNYGIRINQISKCNCIIFECIHQALLLNQPASMTKNEWLTYHSDKNYMPIIKSWTEVNITSLDSSLARHDLADINYFLLIENPWAGKINAYLWGHYQPYDKDYESLCNNIENAYVDNLCLMAPVFKLLFKNLIIKIIDMVLLEDNINI